MALPVPQNMNVDSSSKSASEAGDIVGASKTYDFSGPRIGQTNWTVVAIAGAAVVIAWMMTQRGK